MPTIALGTLGSDLSSRQTAADLRRQLEEDSDISIIDWAGVCTVSPSFADELLGVLIMTRGPEWVRHNVHHANLTYDLEQQISEALVLRFRQ